jgi:hypothetical protein
VRALDDKNRASREKEFHFHVFVQQKWTPYLMMLTLYNSLSELNEFADEATYRLSGQVEMNGDRNIALSTMQTTGEMPMPAPLMMAGWFGDKFNRLYLNNVKTPEVKAGQRDGGPAAGAAHCRHRERVGGDPDVEAGQAFR